MSVASDLTPFEDPRGPKNLPPAQAARMQRAGLITQERGRWVLTVEGLQALDKKLRGRSGGRVVRYWKISVGDRVRSVRAVEYFDEVNRRVVSYRVPAGTEGTVVGVSPETASYPANNEYRQFHVRWDSHPSHVSTSEVRNMTSIAQTKSRSSGATGVTIVASESPLKYPHGTAQRISLVDPSAPPPREGEPYFAEVIRTSKYSAKGKLLAKPRVVEKIPGALPGTRAWIDYSAGPGYVYIHYMRTRSDSLQRGLQKKLVDSLVERYGQGVDYDFGPVHHEGVWKLLEALRARGIQARGKIYFR